VGTVGGQGSKCANNWSTREGGGANTASVRTASPRAAGETCHGNGNGGGVTNIALRCSQAAQKSPCGQSPSAPDLARELTSKGHSRKRFGGGEVVCSR
jgi:hypothetical protein